MGTGCRVPGQELQPLPCSPPAPTVGCGLGLSLKSKDLHVRLDPGSYLGCKCRLEFLVGWVLCAGLREATEAVSAVKIPFSGETLVIDTGFAPGVAGGESKDEWKTC